jgi:hypothetical protein
MAVFKQSFVGEIYRGVPSSIEGEDYEWVCLVTKVNKWTVYLEAGTMKKLRHLKELKKELRESGYKYAMCERHKRIVTYYLESGYV